MTPYSDMTIWQLKCERDKIDAELRTRTNRPAPFADSGGAMALLRDYYAAYPHGRLGERARDILGTP